MKPKSFPSVSQELLSALEALFPNRIPMDPQVTIQEVCREQGKQDVINYLRTAFEKQNKTVLEKD